MSSKDIDLDAALFADEMLKLMLKGAKTLPDGNVEITITPAMVERALKRVNPT